MQWTPRIALRIALVAATAQLAWSQTTWVDWTSADPPGVGQETAVGTLGPLTVTFTGDIEPDAIVSGTSSFWSSGSATYTSALVTDPPPTGDIIRLTGGSTTGVQVLTFSAPVQDPVIAVLSLGAPGTPASYDFDVPFVIENNGPGHWGNGPLTALAGDVLQGQEGHGIVRFPGTHTEIRFTMPVAEFWHGITVAITGGLGTQLCSPAVANSTGYPGTMTVAGSAIAADNDVVLSAARLPQNSFGYFLTSQTSALVPNAGGSQGTLCLGGTVSRYDAQVQNTGGDGAFAISLDLSNTPSPTGIISIVGGQTWIFQCWYRDAVGGSATSNFTDSVSVDFL